ncbi:MAG: hypothetical protein ACOC22_02045 [bacterium]
MPRPTRKKIKFSEESVNDLLQEIYNDSHNIKAKIARLFTKWEQKVKEGGEIQAIGDQIVKLISAEAKNQDQKIMLLKYLKEVVFRDMSPAIKGSKEDDGEGESENPTTDRRNELLSMVQQHVEKSKKQ